MNNFSEVILEKVGPLFKRYNFHVVEQQDYYLRFSSGKFDIAFVQDKRDKANNIFFDIIREKIQTIEIGTTIAKLFFNSDLKLSDVPTDVFVNNLVLFFENEGKPLLTGEREIINELEKFSLERSRIYAKKFIRKTD